MDRADLVIVLEESRQFGFLGPGDVSHQYAHSADLAAAIGPFAGRFVDLGSGGGLPGLVLAERWPETTGVLLDAQQRRCAFLEQAVARLGLHDRFTVACGRAERLARDPEWRLGFDLVVARSFAIPAVTAECAVGFLAVAGRLVVTEPPETASLEDRWPRDGLATLGFGPATAIRHGATGAMATTLERRPSERWPRREGIPGKRPLW